MTILQIIYILLLGQVILAFITCCFMVVALLCGLQKYEYFDTVNRAARFICLWPVYVIEKFFKKDNNE